MITILMAKLQRTTFLARKFKCIKLEGYAITNVGYSSGTEGKSRHEKN